MKELNLPHQAPLRFAKYVIREEENFAMVKVKFDHVPTLPMLVEAAAQSSAAFSEDENKMGFLVSLKNVKLFKKPTALEYDVKVTLERRLEKFNYFDFEIYNNNILFATGAFIISVA